MDENNDSKIVLLREDEVAKLLDVSVHWLRRMRCLGCGLKFVKLSQHGAVRYRKIDVESFILERIHN